jgi:LacI family transcriptional regulator
MTKKPSLVDIAQSLGVSKTLVSLVVNNKGDAHGISAETQKKVKAKIKELNYEPNIMARGFRTGKTQTIGLVVSDISNRFYARVARKIEDYAWSHGYTVIICSTDEIVEKEKKQINMLRDKKIDGLIISTSQTDTEYFDKLVESSFPHVLIDRVFKKMKSPSVSVDNFGGGRLAARHLITQGITRAAIIGISPEHISTINDRVTGFETAMAEADFRIPDDWKIRAPFEQIEKVIKEKLQYFYQSGDMPDAIFTLNNNLTATTMKLLRKLSLRVPQDLLLIGFDDVMYFSFMYPSITAIGQPVDHVSEKAFDLLLKQIQKKDISEHEKSVVLPVEILIRESSLKNLNV